MDSPFVGVFSIGQTLDRGIRLYKTALAKVIVFLVVPSLFGLYLMPRAMNPNPQNPLALFGPAYFISLFLGLYVWIVTTRYIYHLSLGEEMSVGDILKLAGPKDLLFILTYITATIVMILSMLALVIPFVYLLNLVSIIMIVAVVERTYFFGWLPRAFKLTRGRWWKTFVINVVTFIIFFIPLIVAMSIWGSAAAGSTVAAMESMAEGGTMTSHLNPLAYVGAAIYVVTVSLLTPLLITINIVHYNSLRSEKENVDIEKQLDGLQAQPS